MSARSIALPGWTYDQVREALEDSHDVEDILERLATAFTEVNIAADFLHMRAESWPRKAPERQLTCLIKERIAAIQEQVTELYHLLNQGFLPHPLLRQ